jgi:hypothetical protein
LIPTSLNYGNQAVGNPSASKTVTLKNSGTAALTIVSLVASGDYSQTNSCGASLAVGASCVITVTFTPTALGLRSGAVTINDNALGTPHKVTLTGTGTKISLAPTSLSFGNQPVQTTSPAKTITVTNSSLASVNVTGVSATGNFAPTTGCVGTLAPLATCTVSVTFTPTAAGARTGTLTVANSSGTTLTAPLSGTGTFKIALSPTSLSFGNQPVLKTSGAKTVTVTNPNGTPITITGITTTGDFAESNTCPLKPATLAGSGTCMISVTFTPSGTGPATGTVTIADDASGNPQTVPLSGTGTLPVTVSPTSLNFGNQKVAITSAAKAVTFSNPNVVPVTITGISVSGDFGESDNCPVAPALLGPGGSCTITVTFTPTVIGPRTGLLSIADNGTGSPQKVTLSGTGTLALTVSPTILNFGNQLVGTTSTAKTVTVSNPNGAPITISSVVGSAPFAVSSTCPIAPSALGALTTCTISVTFTPAVKGTQSGTVTIAYTGTGSPQKVTLTGKGI